MSKEADNNTDKSEILSISDFSPVELLTQLWEKGKTYKKLSDKVADVEINGELKTIHHNRISDKAFLRITDPKDEEALRLVLISAAYNIKKGGDRYAKPEISSEPKVLLDAKGKWDKKQKVFSADYSGQSSKNLLHALQTITDLCDASHNIRKFVFRWDGNLTELLGHALINQFFQDVRITPDNELVIYNYAYKSDSDDQNG